LGCIGGYLAYLQYWTVPTSDIVPPGGTLIIGGGNIPEDVCKQFVQLAGGSQARLVVIPSYKPTDDELKHLKESWQNYHVASLFILNADTRDECDNPQFAKPISEATGVWITGGLQTYVSERYVDTEVERQLKALLDRNGVIGGSSAGAAIMTRVMIGSGRDEATEEKGFDLLSNVVVDQHFLRRNRIQRLLGVLNTHPGLIGLGIDERTAVMIQQKGRVWNALGESYVMICLPQENKDFPRIEILKPGDHTDIEILKQRPGTVAISSAAALDRYLENNSVR
jgi:cyanophycinase